MTNLLKQIKSDDIEIVYRQVTETATIWALCGFVDQANKLLEKLWSFNLEHTGNTWLNDGGFQIVWHLTKKKPNNIPFELQDIKEIEEENWDSHFTPYWNENDAYKDRIKGKKWSELRGNDLLLVGIELAYDENKENNVSDKEHQIESLKAITKYLDTERPLGHALMDPLVCASILASRNGLTKEAGDFIVKWGESFKYYAANTFTSYLLRDVETTKIILTGILAPIFGLTKEACETEYVEISSALDSRISKGQSLAYEKLKWKDLLGHISSKAISKPDFEHGEENQLKTSLTSKPATKEEIEKAEERLEIKLPKEYKDFLLVSNGFCPYSLNPTLLPVDKIDWLKNLDEQLIDIWTDSMDEVDKEFAASFSSSLLIGGYKEEQQLLLIPSKKSKDWECWFFASWVPGETKYPNFRYYMENLLKDLDAE